MPFFVRLFEGRGDVLRDRMCLVDRERTACQTFGKRLAFDNLHDEEVDAIVLFERMEGGDVRMVQRGEELSFALEALHPLRILRERLRQYFDRFLALQLPIGGAIDLNHAAHTESLDDLVVP